MERCKLPARAGGYTQKMRIGDIRLYLRTAEYADGSLGGIRLDYDRKADPKLASALKVVEEVVTLGLNYGVPLEKFVDRFVFFSDESGGVVRGHDRICMGSSIVDVVFRDLAIHYLGRDDLAHRAAADHPPVSPLGKGGSGIDKTPRRPFPKGEAREGDIEK